MLDAAGRARRGPLIHDGRWRAGTIWLAMWATDGFLFHLDSTVFSVFLILQVGSDPLQLVLMGTILEVSYLLFEIPTGIVADAVSRKWSLVIGYLDGGIALSCSGSRTPFVIAASSTMGERSRGSWQASRSRRSRCGSRS